MKKFALLGLLSAACVAGEVRRKEGIDEKPAMPEWLTERCTTARQEVMRVLRDEPDNGKKLTDAIGELKEACRVAQTDEGDVLGVMLEDVAEDIAAPRRNVAATCDAVLNNFDLLPKVCGMPDVSILMDKCGPGRQDGPWYSYHDRASYMQWVGPGNNQVIQFFCWHNRQSDDIEFSLDYYLNHHYIGGESHLVDEHRHFLVWLLDSSGQYHVQGNRDVLDRNYRRRMAVINTHPCSQNDIRRLIKRLKFCYK